MELRRLPTIRSVIVVSMLIGVYILAGCRDDAIPPTDWMEGLIESAPLLGTEQVAVYGLSGSEGDAFTFPQFVGRDEEGYVYIHDSADRGATELKRFAPNGQFDRLVLRAGDGKFNWLEMVPPAVWVENTASIVIWNRPTAELLVFDSRGEMLSRTSWARLARDFKMLLPRCRYRGDFLAWVERDEPGRGIRSVRYMAALRISGDGAVVDTVWSQRRPGDDIRIEFEGGSGNAGVAFLPLRYGYSVPFGRGGVLEVQTPEPGSGESGIITLTAIGGADPGRSRTLRYRPLSLPEGEIRERMLDGYRRRYSRAPGGASALRTIEENLDVPSLAAPVRMVHGFPDGSIWIRLALTADALVNPGPVDQQEFLVVGLQDEPSFRVVLPRHRGFQGDQEGRIGVTMETDSGEPYVSALAVRR